MTRESWYMVIAIAGWLLCGAFAFGYNIGEKYELKRLQTPIRGIITPNIKELEEEMEKVGYYCPNKESNPRIWLKK